MHAGRGARAYYVLLVVIATVLLLLLIWPFASALFVASVLAGALHPLSERFTRKLRGHRNIAAGLLTTAVILCIILPIATLAGVVTVEIIDGIAFVRAAWAEGGGIEGLVTALPDRLQGWVARAGDLVPIEDIGALATEQGSIAATTVGTFVAATSGAVLQTVFMLIMLFFLLVDGARLLEWIDEISPLRRGQVRDLLLEFRNVSRAVIVSALATALVQTVVAAVGYLIVGAPKLLFFSLVTFFCALVPAVGAAGVVLVVALLMFLIGHPWAALFLALWGVLVVGLVDNILKPWLIKSGMQMHGVVVFFALIGGLAIFGAVGLIAGPLVVAFFVAVVRMARRELGNPDTKQAFARADAPAVAPT